MKGRGGAACGQTVCSPCKLPWRTALGWLGVEGGWEGSAGEGGTERVGADRSTGGGRDCSIFYVGGCSWAVLLSQRLLGMGSALKGSEALPADKGCEALMTALTVSLVK